MVRENVDCDISEEREHRKYLGQLDAKVRELVNQQQNYQPKSHDWTCIHQ